MLIIIIASTVSISKSSTHYTVMVYYEDKQCGSLVTFAATKRLNALLTVCYLLEYVTITLYLVHKE